MGKVIDLTGKKFGRLFVSQRTNDLIHPGSVHNEAQWICVCDCGTTVIHTTHDLNSGHVKSCGCLKHQRIIETNHLRATHKKSNTKLYNIWRGMKKRCYLSSNHNFINYGGRGICMCDEWKDSFSTFYSWAIENGYKEGLSIDRIDVDGNYCPENCRWANSKTQANNRTSNKYLEINGETHTLAEWAERFGVSRSTMSSRLKNGYYERREHNA